MTAAPICPTCKGHGFVARGPYRDARPCPHGCTAPVLPVDPHAAFMAAWRAARAARTAVTK